MSPRPPAGVPYAAVLEALPEASAMLFDAEPRIRAVGATSFPGGGFALGAVRNAHSVLARAASIDVPRLLEFAGVPVVVRDVQADPTALARIPVPPRDVPRAPAGVPERMHHRPLVGGLEVQNYDADLREAILPDQITVGTLGALVTLVGGQPAMLSNNHVLAAENRGKKGRDRILQSAGDEFDKAAWCATLHDFVALKKSPPRARPSRGDVVWNLIDAAVAVLCKGIAWKPRYLPARRHAQAPTRAAEVLPEDRVFKVGRTTGYTPGRVTFTAITVGPVGYEFGPAWFHESFVIQGLRGREFSDAGDSGSLIVKPTGEVVGLLYAGDGTHTYACPIAPALEALGCSLATAL